MFNPIKVLRTIIDENRRMTKELLWANIFHDTILGSTWLQNTSFSPGRWAIGYPYLYVLYRVLNEVKPRCILELGLGQSTKMLAQYAKANTNSSHFVIEHDPRWINFFQSDVQLPSNSHLVQLGLSCSNFKGYNVTTYDNIRSYFGNSNQFDLISVDGPFGSNTRYSRVDIVEMIPDSLSDSFVIMMDDTDRSGEKNTSQLIMDLLKSKKIDFSFGNYKGEKDITIICSESLKFLCTL